MARAKPLAELLDRTLGDVLARRGFAGSEIVLAWPEIVGVAFAGRSRPERLVWPKRRDETAAGATLVVRVEPGFALELQYLAPMILDRLATFFGWRCVARLRLEQGRLPPPPAGPSRPPPPSPQARARARQIAAGIGDERLRASLEKLGALVIADAESGAKPAANDRKQAANAG